MNDTRDPDIFAVPQSMTVILGILGLAGGIAWLTTWFFTGGMTAAGVFMIIVFLPLLLMVWNILYMKPSDTRVLVGEGNLVVEVPPYFTATVPGDTIRKAYRLDIASDQHMQGLTRDTGTQVGPYRAGIYKGNGREAIIVSRRRDAICLVTDERLVVLGPRDIEGLAAALSARLGVTVA